MRSLSNKSKQQEWNNSLKMTNSKSKTSHLKKPFILFTFEKFYQFFSGLTLHFNIFKNFHFSPWKDIDSGCVPKLDYWSKTCRACFKISIKSLSFYLQPKQCCSKTIKSKSWKKEVKFNERGIDFMSQSNESAVIDLSQQILEKWKANALKPYRQSIRPIFKKSECQSTDICDTKSIKKDQQKGKKTGLHPTLQRETWIRKSLENESLPDKKFAVLMTNQLLLEYKRTNFSYRRYRETLRLWIHWKERWPKGFILAR